MELNERYSVVALWCHHYITLS